MRRTATVLTLLLSAALLAQALSPQDLRTPEEIHLRNVRQLTFGGENAEAYFNSRGRKLVFSSNRNAARPHETNIFIADWVE